MRTRYTTEIRPSSAPYDVAVIQPCREHHDRGNEGQRHRRAIVRFGQNQTDQHRHHEPDRQKGVLHLVDPVHPSLQDAGHEKDRAQLGQLRGLHANAAVPEPPAAAVDLPAKEDRHQRDGHHPQRHPYKGRLAIVAVVETASPGS
jgi:hypothetical protein